MTQLALFALTQHTLLQRSYLSLLTEICTDFKNIPVETFIKPIREQFLAVLLIFWGG